MVRRSCVVNVNCATTHCRPGIYLVIAIECVGILRRRHRRQIHSMYLLLSAVAMFIAITMVRAGLLAVTGLGR